jgi:hypothetical protein
MVLLDVEGHFAGRAELAFTHFTGPNDHISPLAKTGVVVKG